MLIAVLLVINKMGKLARKSNIRALLVYALRYRELLLEA